MRTKHIAVSARTAGLILFAVSLPFLAIGVFVGRAVCREFTASRPDPVFVLAAWPIAFAFGGFGLLLLILALFGKPRDSSAATDIRRKFRGKTLEDEWNEHRVQHNTAAAAAARLLIAGMLTITVAPSVFLGLTNANYAWLLPLLAPAAALTGACRAHGQSRKFGKAVCNFSNAGRPGDKYRLTIRTEKAVAAQDDYQIELRCEERLYVRSDDAGTLDRKVLWSERKSVDYRSCRSDTGISVSFDLPEDARVSTGTNSREGTFWVLEISAPTSGVDFLADFVLPVLNEKPNQAGRNII